MKKLLILAALLGLTGCGETDQKDSSQTTLQIAPTSVNYRMAASPSALSAPSFGQWVVNGYASEGASTVVNASRTIGGVATESKALITPNVSQVSKILKRGLGGFALTFAVDELLDGIDWVMDPDNNRVIYSESKTGYLKHDSQVFQTYLEANNFCKSKTLRQDSQYVVNSSYIMVWYGTVKCIGRYKSNNAETTLFDFGGSFLSNQKFYLPLDIISQKIIDNAQSGNTDAQAVTFAAAQAIISEAENDATKAKEIEDEFERNYPKCPDGRQRNDYGQCFICGTADLEKRMKIDVDIAKGAHEGLGACKATHTIEGLTLRYNNYVNEAVARDRLNACYDFPHQPHLNQAKEAWRQAQEVCVKYMAAK